MGNLRFGIIGDNKSALKALTEVQNQVSHTAQIVEQQGQSIENVFNRIKSVSSVAFAGFTAKEIVSTLANVRGEFQQLEIAFSTMLGSEEKATDLMKQLTHLAATTPFDMKGVASGAKSLLAYGFSAEEVTDTMRRLGDVCAGLGLNLQDMAWLYGTTRVQGRLFTQDFRQFTGRGIPLAEELAKQFGVTKDKVQELVTAGKVGFPEVQKAMESMTNEGGKFGGLMEKQSHSITGQISNIEDTIEMAINELGTQTEGIMNDALDITSAVIDHWKEIGEVILAAASSIGLYKAMAVGIASFETATSNVGYAAELSALEAILPLKEEERKSDLQEAVAKGQLSAVQAELIASKREEAAAYVASLKEKALVAASEAETAANEANLLNNRANEAQMSLDAYEQQYEAALKLGDGVAIERAENELNNATLLRNDAARKAKLATEEADTAAQVANTAATQANTAEQALNTSGTVRDTAAKGIWAQVTLLCEKVQTAWNASMFASPLFWIAATIAGVTYAVYKLVTAESEHEKALKASNEAWDEFDKKIQERQSTIEGLIRTIQSESATEYQRAEAYQKLALLAPQLTEKYDQATLASMDFSKAQKDVADNMDDLKYEKAKEDVEKYAKELETAKNNLEGTKKSGGFALFSKWDYDSAEEKLKQAQSVLANIVKLREEASENAQPIELKLSEARENESVRQEILDFYDKAMMLANDWQSANETINFATGETRLDEFIAKAEKDVEDLRNEMAKNPADVRLRLKYEEKSKVLNHLLNMKEDWSVTGATTIPLIFKADWQSAKQSLNQAKSKASALANGGSMETYAQAYTKAKKAYDDAQKKVASVKKSKSASVTDYETASNDLKAAKDAFEKLGGDVSNKSKTTTKSLNKEKNKREKTQKELNEKLKALEQKNIDESISLMKDGTDKKIKEIDNDYKKRLDEIKKQEAEFKKKNKEAGKKENLTKAQSSALAEARKIAEEEYNQKKGEIYKGETDYLQEYLAKYGYFQEQKLAIAMDYAKKIKEVEESGASQSDKDWQIASLRKEQEKETKSVDASSILAKIDMYQLFGNVGNMMKGTLSQLLSDLNKFIETDKFKDMDVDQQKQIIEAIGSLREKVGTTDIDWKDMAADMQAWQTAVLEAKTASEDYAKLLLEYEPKLLQAQKKLANAKKSGDPQAVADAQKEVDSYADMITSSGEKVKSANDKVITSSRKLAQTTKDVTQPVDEIYTFLSSAGLSQLQDVYGSILQIDGAIKGLKALKEASDAAKDVGEATEKMSDDLENVGDEASDALADGLSKAGLIGQIIAAILKILDVLKDGVGTLLESLITSILGAINGILKNILSGQFIEQIVGAIVSGIGNILDTVLGAIGSVISLGALSSGGPSEWFKNGNAEETEKRRQELADAAERLTKSIDGLKSELQKQSGIKAISTAKELYEAQKQQIDNARKQVENENNYHNDHHSNAYYWNTGSFTKDDGGDWNVITQLLKDYKKKNPNAATETDSAYSYQDLLKLTPEQLDYIRSHDAQQWNAIISVGKYDSSKEKWEALADLAGSLEETLNTLNESLTQISFDSLKDEFISTLMDMDSSAEDFSDKFSEYLMKAVLNAQISNMMEDELNSFYKEWAARAEANGGELAQDDINYLKERWDALVKQGLDIRDQASSITGYTGTSSQSATSGGWESMGQDTADELNGRFTALQIAGESVAQNMETAVVQMESIMAMGISTNGAVSDIRNMMIMTNSYLEDVAKYAKLAYNEFGSKIDDINKRLKEI